MIPDQFRLIATSAPLVRAAGPAAAIWIGNAIAAQDWSEKECKESWWWATKADRVEGLPHRAFWFWVACESRTGLAIDPGQTLRTRRLFF